MSLPPDLEKLLEEAAERGAKKALERVGLHDDDAGKDIADLRTLIESWRTAKRAMISSIIQWMTVGALGALIAGIYFKGK